MKKNEHSRLTLLDSLDKRVNFLSGLCEKLEIGDVKCTHARAEEISDDLRESFDIAVSRAVGRLNVLCEMCLPYVKPGGCFIAMKGPDPEQEISEAIKAMKEQRLAPRPPFEQWIKEGKAIY